MNGLNELKKINEKIERKQDLRLIGWVACTILGSVCIGKYMHQKGITCYQYYLSKVFPEEYSSITDKVVKSFENK